MKPLLYLLLPLCFPVIAGQVPGKMPEVQGVIRPYKPAGDSGIIITSDSAYFKLPVAREVLNIKSTVVEVIPRCGVDSMTIFVRHSYSRIDTLAHLNQPPYRIEWNYDSLPDQDQIHLQFGYKIYQPGGKLIISPALPHQWTIDRTKARERKKYRCREIARPDTIIIDGKADEWKRIKRTRIEGSGSFALCWTAATLWTPATLYFLAEIRLDTVLATDIVELHLDPYRTRTSFASEKHRSVLFGPRSRSYCFVSRDNGTSGYRQCDSIAALLNDGMTWGASVNDTGYIIEASLPFYALSDMDFTPLRFGLDVTTRSGKHPFRFAGWANGNEYARYNPGEWGAIVLHQMTLPLKIAIALGAIILGILLIVMALVNIRHSLLSQRLEQEEARGASKQLSGIQACIEGRIQDPSLSIDKVAAETGLSIDSIETTLRDELDSSFDRYVGFKRFETVKKLLGDFILPLEEIARKCGYASVDEMTLLFRDYQHTGPETFRAGIKERIADEEEDSSPRKTRVVRRHHRDANDDDQE